MFTKILNELENTATTEKRTIFFELVSEIADPGLKAEALARYARIEATKKPLIALRFAHYAFRLAPQNLDVLKNIEEIFAHLGREKAAERVRQYRGARAGGAAVRSASPGGTVRASTPEPSVVSGGSTKFGVLETSDQEEQKTVIRAASQETSTREQTRPELRADKTEKAPVTEKPERTERAEKVERPPERAVEKPAPAVEKAAAPRRAPEPVKAAPPPKERDSLDLDFNATTGMDLDPTTRPAKAKELVSSPSSEGTVCDFELEIPEDTPPPVEKPKQERIVERIELGDKSERVEKSERTERQPVPEPRPPTPERQVVPERQIERQPVPDLPLAGERKISIERSERSERPRIEDIPPPQITLEPIPPVEEEEEKPVSQKPNRFDNVEPLRQRNTSEPMYGQESPRESGYGHAPEPTTTRVAPPTREEQGFARRPYALFRQFLKAAGIELFHIEHALEFADSLLGLVHFVHYLITVNRVRRNQVDQVLRVLWEIIDADPTDGIKAQARFDELFHHLQQERVAP